MKEKELIKVVVHSTSFPPYSDIEADIRKVVEERPGYHYVSHTSMDDYSVEITLESDS